MIVKTLPEYKGLKTKIIREIRKHFSIAEIKKCVQGFKTII